MLFKKILMGLVAAALTLMLGFSITSAQETELEDTRFFLSFIPNIQFAPVYVGQAKGYFEEIGVNLVVEYGDEPIGVEQVAVGDIPYGVISGEQVLLARAGGRPVVYVYEWFQQYPIAVVIPSVTGVETFPELAGMRVGVPGRFGATYSGLTALLNANDMTEADIDLQEIGFNAPDVVCVGGVDAAAVYINNEPLEIQRRIDAGECGDNTGVTVLPVAGETDLVSNGLVVNEQRAAEDPEGVRAFVSAFDRALRDTINNPAEAYLLSAEYIENLPLSDEFRTALETAAEAQTEFLAEAPTAEAIAESRDALLTSLSEQFEAEELLQFQVLLETIRLWEAETLGETTPESWEATRDILNQMEMLPGEIQLEGAYTNAFLPQGDDATGR